MSAILRASLRRAPLRASGARRAYSTTPAPKSSNTPLYLGLAGVAGLAGYAYLQFAGPAAQPLKPAVPLTSALDKDNFVEFPLKKIEEYNHNTAKYIFELPEHTASLLPISSCVVVKTPETFVDAKGKPFVRPYTPISDSDAEGELAFLIKYYPEGNVSKFVHSMKIGDKLAVKGPFPKFPYKSNEFEHIGMIAGGSGITPMYQILKHALAISDDKTKFTLLFANVTPADILLREDFDALKAKHPERFDVVYVVDKADSNWKGPTGYITPDLIKEHIAPASAGDKVRVLVCGPPPQVAAIAGAKAGMQQGELNGTLKELGYTPDQVFKF
ncbi:hypothetical protein BOTBODRAFT_29492 [Botryobasidium botryosum FD-172 SS1]|uniref:NADH-cytochrome b5 reductase n=1 Tax=Botryobasidium botryosum (strain FD-172 SS1) TaxID=930990 RepID=A0A067MTX0_BOTB1|nr:hypothetical protein BOTBODRAFT_29492 [Botryobasidium botryosum FD-172 SS1]